MVGVEAARRGVPSVAFAVGGIPEWLIDGATGTLVPPGPRTRGAVRGGHRRARCPIGRAGSACAPQGRRPRARFSIDAHLQALESVFAEVARRGGQGGMSTARAVGDSRSGRRSHGRVSHRGAPRRATSAITATDADLLAADDLRWLRPALDPAASSRRRWRSSGVAATTSRCSTVIWAALFTPLRPWLDPRPTHRHGHLVPRPRAAVLPRARRRSRPARERPLSARYRLLHGHVMPRAAARQLPRVGRASSASTPPRRSTWWPRAGPRADRVHVLANGVEAECFIDRVPRARGCASCCSSGSGCRPRASATSSQAFARPGRARSDVRLTCVGTGRVARRGAGRRSRSRARPRARACRRRGSRRALRRACARPIVFVFPSLSEGFSKALLEAMAASLPIVTTPVGAAVDLLRDGANALLVPPADAAAHGAARCADTCATRSWRARARRGGARHRGGLPPARRCAAQWTESAVAAVVDRRARDARGVEAGSAMSSTESQSRAAYESVARARLRRRRHRGSPVARAGAARICGPRTSAAAHVLEIGCGRGELACELAGRRRRPRRLVAADFAHAAVRLGAARARPAVDSRQCPWMVADVQAVGLPDARRSTP